jgi:hypothetical protein
MILHGVLPLTPEAVPTDRAPGGPQTDREGVVRRATLDKIC